MEYHIKKDLNYYTKKINNYITLINSGEELIDKEKEIIEKKLIKLVNKLELIKKSEELNIENINNKQKKLLKENLFNQYKAYLTNKNIYLSNNIEDNKDFNYLCECYDYVNKKYLLTKTNNIDKLTIDNVNIEPAFYDFIDYFNKHHKESTIFDIFLE